MKANCCCPVSQADAGPDQIIDVNYTRLDAAKVLVGCGKWSLVSGQGDIKYPRTRNTKVNNLGLGENVFKWTVSHDCSDCCDDPENTTEDTVTITLV